jgi:deazaflavin-dependent oxidoreductase (nitroreductase family)
MTESDVVDSPTGWVRRHIDEYVATDGARGHLWQGYPTLLLTTTGRRSGRRRRTALIYGRSGSGPSAPYVVASYGGRPDHPLWLRNLEVQPDAEIQVRSDVTPVRARVAAGDERRRLWAIMTSIYPSYDAYQARTDRQIPVVVLEPAEPPAA